MHSQPTNMFKNVGSIKKKEQVPRWNIAPLQSLTSQKKIPDLGFSKTAHLHPYHCLQHHQKAQEVMEAPEIRLRRPLHYRGV